MAPGRQSPAAASMQGFTERCSWLAKRLSRKRRSIPAIKPKVCGRREERVMTFSRPRLLISATIFCLSLSFLAVYVKRSLGQDQTTATEIKPKLTEEEMREFLLTAKIIGSHEAPKGVTRPSRLTLSDGELTHDAGFQPIDIFKSFEKFDDGHSEINFRDTYHYNIAAYELAKLLGLESMMPVTVERKWNGKTGSLTWWLDVKMDEGERLQKNIRVPDVEAWNRQMYRKRIFAELVYDTDPNLTNALIGNNWELYMIDFTRAFRLQESLAHPANLVRCDRQLLEKLRTLGAEEVERVTKPHLEKDKIKALMKRRDKIVALFEKLIKEKGEGQVLF
jgi:hypothetical protein